MRNWFERHNDKAAVAAVIGCIILVLFSVPAKADWFNFGEQDEWTKTDVALELAFQATWLIDMRQTLDIDNHDNINEINPLIDPSNEDATKGYFIVTGVGHYLISHYAPADKRRKWQIFTLTLSSINILRNRQVGLRVRF